MDPPNSAESNYSLPGSNINELSAVWSNLTQRRNISLGLRNPTVARCYLNSVVLALLHLPRFVSWLEDHVHGHEGDEWCVACILADLATQYWVDVPNQTDLEEQIDLFIAAIDADRDKRLEKLLELRSRVTKKCTECDNEETSMDFNWQLILSCEENADIEHALAQYFAPENRSGIECDSDICKKKKVWKNYSRKVRRGPAILCTQFNRSRVVTTNGRERIVKDNRKVIYTSSLNLQPVKNGEILRYTLLAAIHHRGTRDKGHYITVAKTPAGTWVRHDDERVDVVDLREALHPTDNFTPYLLFWQKEPETAKSPNKRGRPLDDEVNPDAPPPKKPQNSSIFSTPSSILRRFGRAKPPEPPSSELSDCEKEKAELKELVNRAATAHAQLVDSASNFHAGLDTALKMLATYSPLMQELKDKKKYRARAMAYLKAEKSAQLSLTAGVRRAEASPRLLEIVNDADPRARLRFFLYVYSRGRDAIERGGLVLWLRDILGMNAGREGDAVDDAAEDDEYVSV
ncbi:MAG: hypothetical protein L6R38_007865 [Xanthoria sp. 2 TBL-2021]|nr:MAG: hypothetical protein L6R38_007865 [Xanthoria sp. 2 TBL-2021]